MSLVDKKVVSKYSERHLVDKPKLTLSKNLLDQIDYFHEEVGKDEWSGVLVYKVESGSIEEPNKLELLATHLIPMDIGTAAYTEYEFDLSGDEYQMEHIGGAMLDSNLKMGHVHTHLVKLVQLSSN